MKHSRKSLNFSSSNKILISDEAKYFVFKYECTRYVDSVQQSIRNFLLKSQGEKKEENLCKSRIANYNCTFKLLVCTSMC